MDLNSTHHLYHQQHIVNNNYSNKSLDIDNENQSDHDHSLSNSNQLSLIEDPLNSLNPQQLAERVAELQLANTAKDILAFLGSLVINNSKQGISLSWNRAIKVLKAHGYIHNDFKPFSQLKNSEKNDLIAKLSTVIDPIVIGDLKVAILEGFTDSRYPRKRRATTSKWDGAMDISGIDIANDALQYSQIDHLLLDDSSQSLKQSIKSKLGLGPVHPSNVTKEEELINEKIKNVKIERLRSAINDVTSWSHLSQESRDRITAEYEKLLIN